MRLTRSKSCELVLKEAVSLSESTSLHVSSLGSQGSVRLLSVTSISDFESEMPEFATLQRSLTTRALESPGVQCADRRKRFRSMDRGGSAVSPGSVEDTLLSSGHFDALGDDTVLAIMHFLLEIPEALSNGGLELHAAVGAGCQSLVALLASCKRMMAVLRAIGSRLEMELLARTSTHISPTKHSLCSSVYPYSHQLRVESRSADQLGLLRKSVADMAIHCANTCCENRRKDLNRQLRHGRENICRGMVIPCAKSSTVIASSHSGRFTFIASRIRMGSAQGRHPRYGYEITRQTFTESCTRNSGMRIESLVMNTQALGSVDNLSAPQSMRSNCDGSSVAFIRAVHAVVTDGRVPHSQVSVWSPVSKIFKVMIEPPGQAEFLGAINAQDAWWVKACTDDGGSQLAVIWSTAYVHPMGSVLGASAENACYFIALYDTVDYEVEQFTGPFYGKAQTASPTIRGDQVAVLIRKAPVGNGPGSLPIRATRLHHVHSESPMELDHQTAIGTGRGLLPPHPHDLAHCPSAVGLSPSGDCVVAVHRRHGTVIVEVLLRTASSVFVSVQTMDVTPWTSNGHVEPTIFEGDPVGGTGGNAHAHASISALRLPYDIIFSPCGRFATILDKRATFGLPLTSHALVVLDMALRHERRGVRSLPLAPIEDVAPRSIAWTESGLWIQPKFGTIFLWNPN